MSHARVRTQKTPLSPDSTRHSLFSVCLSGAPKWEVYECLSSALTACLSYSRLDLRRNNSAQNSGGQEREKDEVGLED